LLFVRSADQIPTYPISDIDILLESKINQSECYTALAVDDPLTTKANLNSPDFSGIVTGITKDMVGLWNVDNTSDADKIISTSTQIALDSKANVLDITPALIGLGRVQNTSDLEKPVSTLVQQVINSTRDFLTSEINLKAPQSNTYTKPEVDQRLQVLIGLGSQGQSKYNIYKNRSECLDPIGWSLWIIKSFYEG
jgi:hypothetical protein